MRQQLSLADRLLARATVADDGDGCWEWDRPRPDGYGKIGVGDGRSMLAHRASYETFVGPIPEGLQIDHLCRNRRCIRPDHLEAVTQVENVRRGSRPNRPTCVHGHLFDESNTYRYPSTGYRKCRACNAASEARRRSGADERAA